MTKPEGYEGHYADAATEREAERDKMLKEFEDYLLSVGAVTGFDFWQAACASKQKEIDALQARIDSLHAELGIDL